VSAERADDEWMFSVTDDGTGIDPELSDRVLDMFRSGSGSDGSGSGLAIARKIIDRHGRDDIDVLLALLDAEVTAIDATEVSGGGYATAVLDFESEVVGQLTASRVTQEKVRELTISATDCRVKVDYINQSLEIYRQSLPEYVRDDGDIRYHRKNVVEQVTVQEREPPKKEIAEFVEASNTGSTPAVTGKEALRALEVTQTIEQLADRNADGDAADREVFGASTHG